MTTTVPPLLAASLDALKARADADPSIATSPARQDRLAQVVALLKRAAADCAPEQVRSTTALLHPDTIGHPDHPDTILGRALDGRYRIKPPYKQLSVAYQRSLMDGLADLNRAAGLPPYWWQARGMKPWTKHTRQPITETEHTVLRRALTEPAAHPRWEPFRLRNLALVELFWDTGVHSESLTHADTTDLGPDLADIRLTVNPPGRTAATVQRFPLSPNTRAALRLWLPVRRAVITRHLSAGPDAPANQALFIILAPTTVDQPDGTYRVIPPGIRISGTGLELSYASWARRLNAEHHGQPGWPVPTTFQQLARGGAIAQGHIPDGTPKGRRWALTAEQVAEAAQRRAAGQALVSIAAGFGVNRQTLHSALKRYGHLS